MPYFDPAPGTLVDRFGNPFREWKGFNRFESGQFAALPANEIEPRCTPLASLFNDDIPCASGFIAVARSILSLGASHAWGHIIDLTDAAATRFAHACHRQF